MKDIKLPPTRKRCTKTWLALALLVGCVIGAAGEYAWNTNQNILLFSELKPYRQQQNSYTYISPLLGYEIPEAVREFKEYRTLEKVVKDYTDGQIAAHNADNISVYFRDLKEGRWVGVDELGTYQPASMLKVGTMIAYFKEAESDPQLLERKLVYSSVLSEEIGDIPFQTPSNLVVGKSYTIKELIKAMIIHSDNGAKNALLLNIDSPSLDAVFTDIGLANPDTEPDYRISPKAYSLFLRVLYNATYLSRTMSEEALNILSQATYHDGLAAGLPNGVTVAQKFGEHVYVDTADAVPDNFDLSNCGIIYHPETPYILCVMTHGSSIPKLTQVISGVSRIIYQDVENDYGKKK